MRWVRTQRINNPRQTRSSLNHESHTSVIRIYIAKYAPSRYHDYPGCLSKWDILQSIPRYSMSPPFPVRPLLGNVPGAPVSCLQKPNLPRSLRPIVLHIVHGRVGGFFDISPPPAITPLLSCLPRFPLFPVFDLTFSTERAGVGLCRRLQKNTE